MAKSAKQVLRPPPGCHDAIKRRIRSRVAAEPQRQASGNAAREKEKEDERKGREQIEDGFLLFFLFSTPFPKKKIST